MGQEIDGLINKCHCFRVMTELDRRHRILNKNNDSCLIMLSYSLTMLSCLIVVKGYSDRSRKSTPKD